MSQLEINEEVLVNFSCASNDYQNGLRVLCTFVPNKSFAQLLDISIKVLFSKTFNSKSFYIEICFTNQNSKPLEIEDKIKINLVIN